MSAQPSLCRTWSETPKTGFLATQLNYSCFVGQASSPDAELIGAYAQEVANTAWEVASKSNLKPTNQNTAGSSGIGGSGKRQYSTDAAANQTVSSMGAGSAEASDAGLLSCFLLATIFGNDKELRLKIKCNF